MNQSRLRTVVRASALYDLLVTVGFAVPWTAVATLHSVSWLAEAWGLSGALPDTGDPFTVLFTSLFGTVVVIWSVVRLLTPTALLGVADTAGRALFSAWMVVALAEGASTVLVGFLVLEIAWGLVQGWVSVPALLTQGRRTVPA